MTLCKKKNSRVLEKNAGGYTQRNSNLGRPVFPETIETQRDSPVNIYQQLASIPREIADKITNAKTGGGRSLNAIHSSKVLNSTEKHLMLVLASEMNYTMQFENQYRFISLNSMAEKMSVDKRTISAILNGITKRGIKKIGLIEKGYIIKQIVSIEDQQRAYSNHYCITPKIFDEYMLIMLESHQTRVLRPSDPGSLGECNRITTPSDPGSHKVPVFQFPKNIPNAAAQTSSAAVKRCRPLSKKVKTWDEKSDSEKTDTLYNVCKDAHRTAIEQRKAQPYPWDDIPDMLKPVIAGYGIQKVKDFFDKLKTENRGCDVRMLSREIEESAQKTKKPVIVNKSTLSVENIHQDEEKINGSKNFTEEILQQVETNLMYANKLSKSKKIEIVKIEDFPLRLKKFYDSINSKIQKRNLVREISILGLDKFLELRATIILKCSYDDLFIENSHKTSSFV